MPTCLRLPSICRRVEDLQFLLEEQGITSGDHLESVTMVTSHTMSSYKQLLEKEKAVTSSLREQLEAAKGSSGDLSSLRQQVEQEKAQLLLQKHQLEKALEDAEVCVCVRCVCVMCMCVRMYVCCVCVCVLQCGHLAHIPLDLGMCVLCLCLHHCYAWHHKYTSNTTLPSLHIISHTPVHTTPVHTTPVHTTPVHTTHVHTPHLCTPHMCTHHTCTHTTPYLPTECLEGREGEVEEHGGRDGDEGRERSVHC